MSKKLNNILLGLILIVGFFFRFYQLNSLPPSLNWDEISHGYNAYSLIQTGRDQWGAPWPIFNFRAYGDYPTALNMYLTLPLVYFFGLNSWTVRLPSAILGFLTIPAAYFLAQALFKNKTISLLTAFLVAVSPWTLFPSRAVFQFNTALFFLTAGLAALFSQKYTLTAAFLGLSQYGYHNTRIVTPLLIAAYFLIYKPKILIKNQSLSRIKILPILIFTLFTLPQIINLFSPSSSARSRWTFILNQDAVNLIEHQRHQCSQFCRLRFNKFTYAAPKIALNYLNFLNPYLLFFKGSGQYQFNLPNHGIIFWAFLPFLYLGVFNLFKKSGASAQQRTKFLVSWFFIGLLPAAITYGDYPIIRAGTLLPLPFLLIALSLSRLPRLILPTILIALIQFSFYWRNYSQIYPQKYSQSWQYGYKQAVGFVKTNYSQYQQIIFTKKYGEPHEFILFYWPWPPQNYHPQWDYHANWYWVNAFDKFYFKNDWDIKNTPITSSTLLVTSPGNYPVGGQLIKTINFLDNTPAFDIVSYE